MDGMALWERMICRLSRTREFLQSLRLWLPLQRKVESGDGGGIEDDGNGCIVLVVGID
jgi:hypothetical protein